MEMSENCYGNRTNPVCTYLLVTLRIRWSMASYSLLLDLIRLIRVCLTCMDQALIFVFFPFLFLMLCGVPLMSYQMLFEANIQSCSDSARDTPTHAVGHSTYSILPSIECSSVVSISACMYRGNESIHVLVFQYMVCIKRLLLLTGYTIGLKKRAFCYPSYDSI